MPTNNDLNTISARRGHKLLGKYVQVAKLDEIEAKQDYTVKDAILALMHYAGKRGLDAVALANSAIRHYEIETTICKVCGAVGSPDEHECKGVAAAHGN